MKWLNNWLYGIEQWIESYLHSYKAGQVARRENKHYNENPYKPGTLAYHRWKLGWLTEGNGRGD